MNTFRDLVLLFALIAVTVSGCNLKEAPVRPVENQTATDDFSQLGSLDNTTSVVGINQQMAPAATVSSTGTKGLSLDVFTSFSGPGVVGVYLNVEDIANNLITCSNELEMKIDLGEKLNPLAGLRLAILGLDNLQGEVRLGPDLKTIYLELVSDGELTYKNVNCQIFLTIDNGVAFERPNKLIQQLAYSCKRGGGTEIVIMSDVFFSPETPIRWMRQHPGMQGIRGKLKQGTVDNPLLEYILELASQTAVEDFSNSHSSN